MDVLRLNNGTTRTSSEIRSKLVKILERCRRCSDVFIINFTQISQLVLVFLLLTLNRYVNIGWFSLSIFYFLGACNMWFCNCI